MVFQSYWTNLQTIPALCLHIITVLYHRNKTTLPPIWCLLATKATNSINGNILETKSNQYFYDIRSTHESNKIE